MADVGRGVWVVGEPAVDGTARPRAAEVGAALAGSEAGGDFPPGEGLGEEEPVDLTSGGDGRHFLGAVAGGPLRWPSYRIWHDPKIRS